MHIKADKSNDMFVLLASDGVWDAVTNQEAVDFIVNDQGDPDTVAARLAQYVLKKEVRPQPGFFFFF